MLCHFETDTPEEVYASQTAEKRQVFVHVLCHVETETPEDPDWIFPVVGQAWAPEKVAWSLAYTSQTAEKRQATVHFLCNLTQKSRTPRPHLLSFWGRLVLLKGNSLVWGFPGQKSTPSHALPFRDRHSRRGLRIPDHREKTGVCAVALPFGDRHSRRPRLDFPSCGAGLGS